MLATLARSPWKAALAALAFALAALANQLGPGPGQGPAAPAVAAPIVHVHVKLRAGGAHAWALAHPGARAEAMFAPLPPGQDDARARWLRVRADDAEDARRLAAQLAADPAVEQAFVEPAISLPVLESPGPRAAPPDGESCPITTPSFESYQGYLGPAPHGIDAPAAWRRGYRGAGVWFADIEGGWNATHEDLPGARITHVGGRPMDEPSWREHGTAVLGEVVGRDNGKGVVGIAPDVERVLTSSIDGQSVAAAIDVAARALRPGDVLLIELQVAGPRGRYIPVEYFDDMFDVIKAATDRGVVVIEAAGNGGEDLDHRAYGRKLDRAYRDSGAIMVGAGGPPREGFTDRARLDFSNYGGRVDVQGWGRKVATLDYGDLQACDGPERERHYTGEFSGTSSASPIVAGAAVLLQGIARESGAALAPAALRRLLRDTGTPQTGDTRRAIGPRPDLEQAIRALRRYR
ncbi:MAG TPA: S8 family serine peptidase [Kofleriaceae bacterium]|nr:S8 family serine peptidase [Kofleriaceae bacterium]